MILSVHVKFTNQKQNKRAVNVSSHDLTLNQDLELIFLFLYEIFYCFYQSH